MLGAGKIKFFLNIWILFKKVNLFLFHLSECLPVCVHVHGMCAVPKKVRRGRQIP